MVSVARRVIVLSWPRPEREMRPRPVRVVVPQCEREREGVRCGVMVRVLPV